MQDPSSRYTLSYNGEIYNYRELRKQLTGRWSFTSNGDTEVLLAGLITEGADFLSRIEGMWAFVLWDKIERRLQLARDRMGKKPLFYQVGSTGIACASELPALNRLIGHPWQEDLNSTADYLRYGYYLPGTTAYRNVHEVLPGHHLNWSPDTGIQSDPYWQLSINSFQGTKAQGRELIRKKLIAAVKKRLVADVEVGAFLSGGVDSSLITAIMAKHHNLRPKTFTIGFSDAAFDERSFARTIADRYHTEHFEETLPGINSDLLRPLLFDHIGQPFADSSILPTALVSRLASKHVKVALSGDGGDELFCGYQRYQARAIMRWYTRIPASLRGQAARLIKSLPEPMSHHSRSILKKAHLFLDIAARQDAETPYIAPVMYSGAEFRSLVPELAQRGHSPLLANDCKLEDIHRMMFADALVYLPQDILCKVDRASMAYSLETRAPFLDREVVELAFSFPRHWHRRGFTGKRMLRESLCGLLPRSTWARKKQGFAVPIHAWFRGDLGDELVQMLARTPAPFQQSLVEKLLDNHRKRIRDHGYRLWNIYIYLLWKQHNRLVS